MENSTWTATISISNVRTTLLTLELRGLLEFSLPRLSSGTGSVSAGNSTSRSETQTALFWSHGTSLRRFSAKVWVTHKLLWISTKKSSRGTPNTS